MDLMAEKAFLTFRSGGCDFFSFFFVLTIFLSILASITFIMAYTYKYPRPSVTADCLANTGLRPCGYPPGCD